MTVFGATTKFRDGNGKWVTNYFPSIDLTTLRHRIKTMRDEGISVFGVIDGGKGSPPMSSENAAAELNQEKASG